MPLNPPKTSFLRKVETICPACLRQVQGSLIADDKQVTLHRDCPADGPTRMLLSVNPADYAELDRFYFSVLKKGQPRGRITNYWVLSTHQCQMRCSYCQIDAANPFFEEMPKADLEQVLRGYRDVKLTLSGGEPTLNPAVFDFFKTSRSLKRCTQLATNGLKLSDDDFYRQLKDSGAKEIRISFESFSPIPLDSSIREFDKFVEPKMRAFKNLEKGDFHVSLSPTIFKGVNENLLLETLDYASTRPWVKEISVNGFSWSGAGQNRSRAEMIMPDEMMDVICAGLKIPRRHIFTLQKALFLLLQLANIRICMYTQIIIFVRKKGKLIPLSDYFNMERMERALRWWERFAARPYPIQLLACCAALAYSIKVRVFLLAKDILRMFLANIFKIDFSRYPEKILPVVLNTNCSTLTADTEVSRQCMSAVLCRQGGRIRETFTTRILSKVS